MKSLIVFLISTTCFSCSVITDYNIPQFVSINEAWEFVSRDIYYEYDTKTHNIDDYWQTPQETFDSRLGDCEDFSILLLFMIKDIDKNARIVEIYQSPVYSHICIKLGSGVIIEPQNYEFTHNNVFILRTFTLTEALLRCPKGRT